MAIFTIKQPETIDEIRGKGYVHWKSWHETYPGLIDANFLERMTLDKCRSIAHTDLDHTLIAKDGDEVVGFVVYGACRDSELPHRGEIYAIYVLAAYHGSTVGYELMNAALERLKDFQEVVVWVLKGNERAARFYTRYGFRFEGDEREIKLGTPVTEQCMIYARENAKLAQQLISDRRFFHSIAEPGWLEFRTSLEIASRLLGLGWSVQLGKALHTEDRLALPSAEFKKNYEAKCGVKREDLAKLFAQVQAQANSKLGPAASQTSYNVAAHRQETDSSQATNSTAAHSQMPDKQRPGNQSLDIPVAHNHAPQKPLPDAVFEEILDSYTGVIADWDSGKAGPYLLFRFDIDGLAIAESQADDHRPEREGFSQNNGQACHACAHDGHIALGLALAKVIAQTVELKGRVRLIFQPAEESCRGAYSMVKRGLADGVDYMFGCHLGLGIPSGTVGLATQGFLASQKFLLDIQGQAAHAASAPETGKNALLAAAGLALNLHTLTQYGHSKAFLNVGRLEAGRLPNVIPEHAQLEFEIRAADTATIQDLQGKMQAMVQGHCQARDLSWQLEREGYAEALDPAYLPAYLDQGRTVQQTITKLGFKTLVGPDFAASEDVVTWMNQVLRQGGQAIHLMLGTDTVTAHHHPAFDFKEEDLAPALEALTSCVSVLTNTHLKLN